MSTLSSTAPAVAPVSRRSFRYGLGLFLAWALLVLAGPLGVAGAVLAFFVAALSGNVLVMCLVSLLMCLGITLGLARPAARRVLPTRWRAVAWVLSGAVTLAFAAVAWLVFFQPLATPSQPISLPAGAAYWDLPSGSHIAYLKMPGEGTSGGTRQETPIVRLHGGPGAAAVATTHFAGLYQGLARAGFDVYIYDQVGSGLSGRLANPRDYTVARHVADLEAIRQKIGAERMILMGDSWGTTLAAAYMAAHPERVARAIFTSPAVLSYAEWRGTKWQDLPARLAPADREAIQNLSSKPRFMLAALLAQVSGVAARDFAGDSEMDSYFDTVTGKMLPGVVCDPSRYPADAAPHGFGFWANVGTGSDAAMNDLGRRAELASNNTPVLISKGECDYIKWEVAYQYKTTFANSTLLYFPRAGHAIYMDQPDLYLAAVRAFLLDRPLPLTPYTGSEPPQ